MNLKTFYNRFYSNWGGHSSSDSSDDAKKKKNIQNLRKTKLDDNKKKKELVFAATGKFENFTRKSLKEYITSKGHKLLDKISKQADYLINNDIESISGKNKFANENNIPIISEGEIVDLLKSKEEVPIVDLKQQKKTTKSIAITEDNTMEAVERKEVNSINQDESVILNQADSIEDENPTVPQKEIIQWNQKAFVLEAVKSNSLNLEFANEVLKNDKEIVLAAVQKDGESLKYASNELKNDKAIVLAAVQEDWRALEYASNELKKDKAIVLAAVQKYGGALQYASNDLKNDKTIVLAAVQQVGYALRYASDKLKNDKKMVLAAVQEDWDSLEYASNELKNDKEIVLAAIQEASNHNVDRILNFASEEFKNDKEIVLAAVQKNGNILEYASNDLKKDKAIVLAAVQQDGYALQYASDNLKNDKEIVLAAVQQDGYALQYASDNLKNDKEIILVAVLDDIDIISELSKSMQVEVKKTEEYTLGRLKAGKTKFGNIRKGLKENRSFVLKAIPLLRKDFRSFDHAMYHVKKELMNDKEIVLAAVQQDGKSLKYASDKLKNDKEIVLASVQQDGESLKYASDKLKNDKEIVLTAVQKSMDVLQYASDKLKNDKEIVLAAVQKSMYALQYASDKLKNDEEIVLAAVQKNSFALQYASDKLKNDKEIILAALQHTVFALQYAGDKLKNDKEIVLASVQKYGKTIEYASEKLKNDLVFMKKAIEIDNSVIDHLILTIDYPESMKAYLGLTLFNEVSLYCGKKIRPTSSLAKIRMIIENHGEIHISDILGSFTEYPLENLKYLMMHCTTEQNLRVPDKKELIQYCIDNKNVEIFKLVLERKLVTENVLIEFNKAIVQAGNAELSSLYFNYFEGVNISDEFYKKRNKLLKRLKKGEFTSPMEKNILENYIEDEEILKLSIPLSDNIFKVVLEKNIFDEESIKYILKDYPTLFQYVTSFPIPHEIVLAAVQQDGLSLEYASEELKSDKEIVLNAVQQNGKALEFTNEALKNDKEFVLECLEKNPAVYASLPLKTRQDKHFALEACEKNPNVFDYIDTSFRNDESFLDNLSKKIADNLKNESNQGLLNVEEYFIDKINNEFKLYAVVGFGNRGYSYNWPGLVFIGDRVTVSGKITSIGVIEKLLDYVPGYYEMQRVNEIIESNSGNSIGECKIDVQLKENPKLITKAIVGIETDLLKRIITKYYSG